MPLTAGTRLGPYEVGAQIGVGARGQARGGRHLLLRACLFPGHLARPLIPPHGFFSLLPARPFTYVRRMPIIASNKSQFASVKLAGY